MTRLSILLLLSMILCKPAYAFTDDTGVFDGLEFASETQIPSGPGDTYSLCYTTRNFQIFGLALTSNITGYALSSTNCQGLADRSFGPEQVITAQSLNLLDPNVATIASNSLPRTIMNYGIWVAIGLGMIAVIIRRVKSLMGRDLRGPMRKKAADKILEAMCHAANCDGLVASNEIVLIGDTAERITRRDIRPTDVIHVADHIKSPLTTQDFINFGKGMRDTEKDDMMRAVFYVTLASGRLHPSEYEFLTDLAYGIGMPGEDFRRVMNQTFADLDRYPPA